MEQHTPCQQLDLLELAASAIRRQRLGPIARAEIVSLLKLLINDGSATAKAKGADDE